MLRCVALLAVGVAVARADSPAQLLNVPDCDAESVVAAGGVACATAAEFFKVDAPCNCLTAAVRDSAEFIAELRTRVCDPLDLDADSERCIDLLNGWRGFHNFEPDAEPDLTHIPGRGRSNTNTAFDEITIRSEKSWLDGGDIGDYSRVSTRLLTNWCRWSPIRSHPGRSTNFETWLESDGSEALDWSGVPDLDNVKVRLGVNELPSTMKDLYFTLRTKMEREWRDTTETVNGPTTRRDLRAFTAAQLKAYQDAVQITMDLGMFTLWNEIHAANGGHIHGGAAFLPAHSAFMRIYEMSLQVIGGMETGMPYGGWLVDFALPALGNGRFRFSDVWSEEHGIARWAEQYLDGELFPKGASTSKHARTTRGTLDRGFRNVDSSGSFISPTLVWSALGIGATPGGFANAAARVEASRLAACNIEGTLLHNGHHMAIGGHMGSLALASYDPAFFMHHGFVDSIWRYWQRSAPSADVRATIDSYPTPQSASSFEGTGAHLASDVAPFLQYGHGTDNPIIGDSTPLTNGDLWVYKATGPGAYRVVFPSGLPCQSDLDCGVQPGTSRAEKRLYCSTSGMCAQYVRDNAVCRSPSNLAFMPCQNVNSRCQFSPELSASHGLTPSDDESNPQSWHCVPDAGRKCFGDWLDTGACGAGCQLVKPAYCPNKVNVFGETVGGDATDVEPPVTAPEPVKASFNLMSEEAIAEFDIKTTGSLESNGVTATLTTLEGSMRCSPEEKSIVFTHSTRNNVFGIACGGFLTKGEKFSATFEHASQDSVTVKTISVTRFHKKDVLQLDFDGDSCTESSKTIDAGSDELTLDRVLAVDAVLPKGCAMHVSVAQSSSGSFGVVGFDVEAAAPTVADESSSGASAPSATADEAMFCTGKPGGSRYDACHETKTCFLSPPDADGNSMRVELAAGVCGPRDWKAEVTVDDTAEPPVLTYKDGCGCDAVAAADDGAAFFGTNYRPNRDPYRAQDRLGGNQDTGSRTGTTSLDNGAALLQVAAAVVAVVVAVIV